MSVNEPTTMTIDSEEISNSRTEKRLCVTFYRQLKDTLKAFDDFKNKQQKCTK